MVPTFLKLSKSGMNGNGTDTPAFWRNENQWTMAISAMVARTIFSTFGTWSMPDAKAGR